MSEHQLHHAVAPVTATIQKDGEQESGIVALVPDAAMTVTTRQTVVDNALQTMKRQAVDHVIVLSQLSFKMLKQLSWTQHPVTAILQGYNSGEAPQKPQRVNAQGPLVLLNGIQGQHLGILHFSWQPDALTDPLKPDLSFLKSRQTSAWYNRIEGLEKRMADPNVTDAQRRFFKDRINASLARSQALLGSAPLYLSTLGCAPVVLGHPDLKYDLENVKGPWLRTKTNTSLLPSAKKVWRVKNRRRVTPCTLVYKHVRPVMKLR